LQEHGVLMKKLFFLLLFSAGVILAADFPFGLNEFFTRINSCTETKPYELLMDKNGYFQSELLIFKDIKTKNEVWKLTNDDEENGYLSINFQIWNCNGSLLAMRTGRLSEFGGALDNASYARPGRYTLNADGSNMRYIRTASRLHNVKILPAWDPKNPDLMYTCGADGIYSVNIKENYKVDRIYEFEEEKKYTICCPPSPDGHLLLFSKEELSFITIKTDGTDFHEFSIKNKVIDGKHKSKWEQDGVHTAYFIGDKEIGFNFGPSETVGEALFYTFSLDGSKWDRIYPDGPYKVPYYSHPGWNYNGTKVVYYNDGLNVANRDGSGKTRIASYEGGHTSWNNIEDDWVFASPSPTKTNKDNVISRIKTDGSIVQELCSTYREVSNNYGAIPKVIASPDGTKAAFCSNMASVPERYNLFMVVAKKPEPPAGLDMKINGNKADLTWNLPKQRLEIASYVVYKSEESKEDFTQIALVKNEGTFTDEKFDPAKTTYYVVSSLEHSGLESDTAPMVFCKRINENMTVSKTKTEKWIKKKPEAVKNAKVELAGKFPKLSWDKNDSTLLRYYNIYSGVTSGFIVSQNTRISSPTKDMQQYLDWQIIKNRDTYYKITAVDRFGNESEPVLVGPVKVDKEG